MMRTWDGFQEVELGRELRRAAVATEVMAGLNLRPLETSSSVGLDPWVHTTADGSPCRVSSEVALRCRHAGCVKKWSRGRQLSLGKRAGWSHLHQVSWLTFHVKRHLVFTVFLTIAFNYFTH